jgi:hypothetical protein
VHVATALTLPVGNIRLKEIISHDCFSSAPVRTQMEAHYWKAKFRRFKFAHFCHQAKGWLGKWFMTWCHDS